MSLSNPIFILLAVAVALAIPVFIATRIARDRSSRIALVAIGVLCIAAPGYLIVRLYAPHLVDARYRAYREFYDDLEIGMTREQVLAALENHYPTDGPRQRPKPVGHTEDRMGFFMNPEHSHDPNCEGIFLDFSGGQMTRKRYSPD